MGRGGSINRRNLRMSFMNDLRPRNDCGQYYIVASVRSWNFKFGGQKISYLLAERSLCSIPILHFLGKHNGIWLNVNFQSQFSQFLMILFQKNNISHSGPKIK